MPLTILLIFIILYTMFRSFKWAMLILVNVMLARIGGLLALLVTHTNFSVSSGVGFLALFGVSVQTGVIMLEYINQLRARGHTIVDSAVEGAVLRLRPIMMTMLVATLGLLPAAMSHGIGSDSQRPFAIVIVGGLISDLVMSIFLLPTSVCVDGRRERRAAGARRFVRRAGLILSNEDSTHRTRPGHRLLMQAQHRDHAPSQIRFHAERAVITEIFAVVIAKIREIRCEGPVHIFGRALHAHGSLGGAGFEHGEPVAPRELRDRVDIARIGRTPDHDSRLDDLARIRRMQAAHRFGSPHHAARNI